MYKTIKKQVRDLWDCSFGDNPKFTDLYFEKRYSDERNVAIIKHGQVLSALQLLPYTITSSSVCCIYGLRMAYISGAATLPEFRNQGLMKQLLLKSFVQMQKEEIPIATLIPAEPWLFDYYSKSDFATVFYSHVRNITKKEFHYKRKYPFLVEEYTQSRERIQTYLNRTLYAQNRLAIRHSDEDLDIIFADLALSNGFAITVELKKEIVGLAFVWIKDNTAYINELVANSEVVENRIHQYLFRNKHVERIQQTIASNSDEGDPLGMLRIIDVEWILNIYAKYHPRKTMRFNLTDPIIPENSGHYTLDRGICRKQKLKMWPEKKTVIELTEEIFLPLEPHMSLMLN